MAFWSNPNSQPKLAFKWYATFGNPPDDVKTYTLRSFQKPSFGINVSEYTWLNDVKYQPGVLTWNPIEITVTDGEATEENNARKLYNILLAGGYANDGKISNIQKNASREALGGIVFFQQIDSHDNLVERWALINPFLLAVNFGQGNYTSEEIMTITLTIRYDYALYKDFSVDDEKTTIRNRITAGRITNPK